jgi:hypothetical protein
LYQNAVLQWSKFHRSISPFYSDLGYGKYCDILSVTA